MATPGHTDIDETVPPIGGTWPRLYAAVIIILAAAILGAWLFSRVFT